MFRFFKNIFNAIVIVLVISGIHSLYSNHFFDDVIGNCSNFFKQQTEKTAEKVGDFSHINEEYHVDTAVNVLGYKAVLAEHGATSQRLIILDSGKKKLLTPKDIKGDGVDEKLENLSQKFKYQNSNISDIQITKRGTMYAYGREIPYVRFNAKVTKLPISDITGTIGILNDKPKDQRLLISVNEKNRYSQLITDEFYKNVKESK